MLTITVMREVARLRAAGYSWGNAATEVGFAEKVVRRWTTKNNRAWRRISADAIRNLADDCQAEAVLQLRGGLRSELPKERADAASKLIRFAQQAAKREPPADLPSVAFRMAEYVQSLDDTQLDRLLADLANVPEGGSPIHSSP
jgi:hypothetical protein